jgi:Ca-activated chloride channel family protein
VIDIYPKRLPDLFGVKPVIIMGRYTRGATGVVRLRGKTAGIDFYREVHVDLPEAEPRHDALASLWARIRIDDLMALDYKRLEAGVMRKDIEEAITQLGLDYRVMTQFTSFIAVSDVATSPGVAPLRVEVPIAMPGGAADQTVMISSSLSTETSSRSEVGSTIVQRRLDNLPLNMQQPSELAKLAPGAAPT